MKSFSRTVAQKIPPSSSRFPLLDTRNYYLFWVCAIWKVTVFDPKPGKGGSGRLEGPESEGRRPLPSARPTPYWLDKWPMLIILLNVLLNILPNLTQLFISFNISNFHHLTIVHYFASLARSAFNGRSPRQQIWRLSYRFPSYCWSTVERTMVDMDDNNQIFLFHLSQLLKTHNHKK